MAKKRGRRRRLGTITGRGSRSFLGALFSGDGMSGLLPVLAGAGIGVGATAAVRMLTPPLKEDNTVNPFWKWAPALGAASGLLVGAGFYFFGGKKSAHVLASVIGAALPTGALLANEAWNRHLQEQAAAGGEAATLWAGIQAALGPPEQATPTAGMGVIVPRGPMMAGVQLGRVPGMRILQGTQASAYGQNVYN